MNIQELTTWNRLSRLDLDAASVDRQETELAVLLDGHPVTPSDEIDQVWHLHLTYSRHYWDTLCRDTLGAPLHHGPTEGGAAEDRKFHDWYENTLASYRRYFGEPPTDLWPSAEERFDERHEFVRIDRRDVVTLDRALLKRVALAVFAGGGMLAVANAIAQADSAAGSSGSGAFLVTLAVLGVVVVSVAAAWRSRRPRVVKSAQCRSSSATAGSAVCGYAGSGGNHCPPGGDCNTSSEGGGAGCGSSSGCGGGGGGCGGS